MRNSTLQDIALKSGYSISTISRVINGKSDSYRISEDARNEILRVAEELNYKPNFFAQNLRKRSTQTIGLVLPHIENLFFASIASVIIREAKKSDYTVVLIDSMEDSEEESKALASLLSRKVDGIIIVPAKESAMELEDISNNTPVVLMDRYFPESNLSYVATNNYVGAQQATKSLVDAGHERILCICGPEVSITTKERVRGYVDVMKEAGCFNDRMIRGNEFSSQNGYIETKIALNNDVKPTAIFAQSITILLGVIKALNEQQLRIPDDISVVSFDDNSYLDYLNPPITCIKQPIDNIAVIAVKMILSMIEEQKTIGSQLLLKPTLVKRDSIRIINTK